jgi:hypothetical protein
MSVRLTWSKRLKVSSLQHHNFIFYTHQLQLSLLRLSLLLLQESAETRSAAVKSHWEHPIEQLYH